ncbi:MAG: hypothetical protein WBA68_10755 [Alteraurantiacibacter sp.]
MGIAASAAFRDDSANGPAYGSLEGLGGPRKLKKKPVLVLDPEELAQAHAMFHEASAELLGEDVERAPRPAMVLGLAPMLDDEPDEVDEEEAEVEGDVRSSDAVLSITRRKSSPLPPLDCDADDVEGYASPDGPVQDDIDLATRIFPSLPLCPELAEDKDYAADDCAAPDYDEPVDEISLPIDPDARLQDYAPLPVPEPEPETEPNIEEARAAPEPQPVSPPTPQPSALDALRARRAEAPVPVEQAPVEPAPEPEAHGPKPARFDELPPNKDYDTPEEVYELDSWLADEPDEAEICEPEAEAAAQHPVETFAAQSEPEVAIDPALAENFFPDEVPSPEPVQDDPNVTTWHDDEVDGYAFMRDPRSRRAAVTAATPGRQSALRAKLLREAEEEAAAKAAQQAIPQGKSLFASLWRKLTGRR